MTLEGIVHKCLDMALFSPYWCMSATNIWFFPTSLIRNKLWKRKVTTNIGKYGLQTYVKYFIWNDKYFLSFLSLITHSLYLSGVCLRSQQDTTKTKLVSSGLNFLARFFINTLMIFTDPILWVLNTKRDSKLGKIGKWEKCCIFCRH